MNKNVWSKLNLKDKIRSLLTCKSWYSNPELRSCVNILGANAKRIATWEHLDKKKSDIRLCALADSVRPWIVWSADIGFQNMAVCKIRFQILPTPVIQILDWKLVSLEHGVHESLHQKTSYQLPKIKKKQNLKTICDFLMQFLSQESFENVDWILLENQPCFNHNMRATLYCVYMWMQTTFHSPSWTKKSPPYIDFVSPTLKTKTPLNGPYWSRSWANHDGATQQKSKKRKIYLGADNEFHDENEKQTKENKRERKQKAIELCQTFLTNGGVQNGYECLYFFQNSKKKDDLADCFLQCLARLNERVL